MVGQAEVIEIARIFTYVFRCCEIAFVEPLELLGQALSRYGTVLKLIRRRVDHSRQREELFLNSGAVSDTYGNFKGVENPRVKPTRGAPSRSGGGLVQKLNQNQNTHPSQNRGRVGHP
jgi:hypothetical protein